MVDTVDSKSAAGNGVRVQVPPGVQGEKQSLTAFFVHRLPIVLVGSVLFRIFAKKLKRHTP